MVENFSNIRKTVNSQIQGNPNWISVKKNITVNPTFISNNISLQKCEGVIKTFGEIKAKECVYNSQESSSERKKKIDTKWRLGSAQRNEEHWKWCVCG